jgi:DNA invertase Pin-like site-specific DNA recombinase
MSKTRRPAVSYSRFSDLSQAGGDSSDRQQREFSAFCGRHDLAPGKLAFADEGRSGFHDDHRKKGKLGELIAAAKNRVFDAGTVIVVEAWDRLGRLRPDRQVKLVTELLETGVSIGICRLDDIFTEDDFGTHKWTTLSVFIQLAYQESKQKADRVAASWERRRQRAREGGALVTNRVPAWVEKAGGVPRLVPERAAVVKRIFELAADGLGYTRIVQLLDAEKVPAFGKRVVRKGRKRSQFSGRWTKPYVSLLLRDRRTVGEFQPMKRDKDGSERPAGPLLPNYYPAAVTEEEFSLARAAQESRANYGTDSKGRRVGPRQAKYVNVFKGLLTHARDGEGMLLHNKGTGKAPELLLINARGNEGRSKCYTVPYLVFEEQVLGRLREIDPESVLPRAAPPSRVKTLRAELAKARQDIAGVQDDLKGGYSKALTEVLKSYETAEREAAEALQDELARAAKPLARTWGEVPTLIDVIRGADDPDLARLRLRPVIRALVSSAVVLIVPRGAWRFVAVQLHFTGGSTRHYLFAHRPAANRRPTRTLGATSFAGERAAGDFDLSKPEDIAALERLVTSDEMGQLLGKLLEAVEV